MATCANVTALARELGIRRKWLYAWRDQAKAAPKRTAQSVEESRDRQTIASLNKRVAELQQLAGRQAAEIDFFKGALCRIEERRQLKDETGGGASTTKSEA